MGELGKEGRMGELGKREEWENEGRKDNIQ